MKSTLTFLLVFISILHMNAQSKANYQESEIPPFKLSDPLVSFNGKTIGTTEEWENIRRPEIIKFFEHNVYGAVPGPVDKVSFSTVEQKTLALEGKAYRKQVVVTLGKNDRELAFTILLYLPVTNEKPPIFLGYNFLGNHTIINDEGILISPSWSKNNSDLNIENHTLDKRSRGMRANRWDVDQILASGMGLATIYYGEIDPDKNDLSDGIQALYYKEGQERPLDDEWGAVAAWAFGLSKAMDYFQTDMDIDASSVIVFGHSRLGKAALWAGATDSRFAAVISNNSGCGGAALSKRRFGETIAAINTSFPHWFCTNYKEFNEAEDKLPLDQHTLLASIAPRPLYVASAVEDQWADPKGEFLSTVYASPVYELYKLQGISQSSLPALNQPIQNTVGYHIRKGKHDVTDYDWQEYIRWSKKVLNLN